MASIDEIEIENEKRIMKQDILSTELKKENFIKEIKSGLGDMIIKEPNKIQKKPTLWDKIKNIF
jgi:hypothetical protein